VPADHAADQDRSRASDGAGSGVVLVGSPNVGKSALFGALTGTYVTVSNYPGTTVEIRSPARSFSRSGRAPWWRWGTPRTWIGLSSWPFS
jgi:ferrous iron transport protein B